MIGLYPNAGHDYYLIHSPLVESTTLHLANGRDFRIVAENFGENNPYVQKILLNGKPHESTRLSHADLMAGGELRMVMGKKGGNANRAASIGRSAADTFESTPPLAAPSADAVRVKVTYTLHGQKRRFIMTFTPADKGWSAPRLDHRAKPEMVEGHLPHEPRGPRGCHTPVLCDA